MTYEGFGGGELASNVKFARNRVVERSCGEGKECGPEGRPVRVRRDDGEAGEGARTSLLKPWGVKWT
ncbi:MAG: hypothetical protein NVSMB6_33100 [Burkholderiaceae bacterium]